MATPRVSVVMAVYNGLPYVEAALNGIRSQTFTDFEAIIVDDASTDGTWDFLAACAADDSRLVLLRNEHNLGVAHSRNAALIKARGTYIACHDADDVSLPDRLARQVEFLDANPAVGLLGTFPEFIDEHDNPLELADVPVPTDDDGLQRQLLDTNCFCAGSVMLRREVLDKAGLYHQDLAPSEDYDMWLRLAELTKLANLPERLYRYRQHAASASRLLPYVQMRNKALALERAFYRRYGAALPGGAKELLARDFVRVAYIGFAAGEHANAREAVARAVSFMPSVLNSGSLVATVVERYVSPLPTHAACAQTEEIFSCIFPATRHLERAKAQLISRLHMREVFKALQEGQHAALDTHLAAGLKANPGWLLNRGVLSTVLKHYVLRPGRLIAYRRQKPG